MNLEQPTQFQLWTPVASRCAHTAVKLFVSFCADKHSYCLAHIIKHSLSYSQNIQGGFYSMFGASLQNCQIIHVAAQKRKKNTFRHTPETYKQLHPLLKLYFQFIVCEWKSWILISCSSSSSLPKISHRETWVLCNVMHALTTHTHTNTHTSVWVLEELSRSQTKRELEGKGKKCLLCHFYGLIKGNWTGCLPLRWHNEQTLRELKLQVAEISNTSPPDQVCSPTVSEFFKLIQHLLVSTAALFHRLSILIVYFKHLFLAFTCLLHPWFCHLLLISCDIFAKLCKSTIFLGGVKSSAAGVKAHYFTLNTPWSGPDLSCYSAGCHTGCGSLCNCCSSEEPNHVQVNNDGGRRALSI